jgi:hypothetical protein
LENALWSAVCVVVGIEHRTPGQNVRFGVPAKAVLIDGLQKCKPALSGRRYKAARINALMNVTSGIKKVRKLSKDDVSAP